MGDIFVVAEVLRVADMRGIGELINFANSTLNELAPPHTTINRAPAGKGGNCIGAYHGWRP